MAKNAVKKAQDISGTVRLITRPHKRKDRSSDVNNEHTATKSATNPPVLITDLTLLFNVMIFLMPLQPQQGFQVYRSGYIRKNRHLFKGLGLYGCTFMVSSLPKGICILKHWSEHRSSSRGQKLLNYKSIHFFAYFSFIYKIVSV